ncbi:NTF2-domain-containing protein [Basidiobolus meristosporus CBS 931.73]|uniref:NTF2-domain-containing protein n=1 Tax=Basidiobolus meristosporus CBS 931.73 TaxID=1314790 RepID=A0A1Y1Y3G2_9FUNG|nr:NTF2-domain-containing protein [Basidiobolus meristosporus CBS 931.73]|eukprot:ORX92134.1 NTF2-domain-containing protein [Basidiobolus meristosporus CBS 931.73]
MTATTNSADASNPPQKIESYEVGWMFVQEYYTFLNKDSSRLHCFYNKKSTMIHGTEGEQVKPYHGQQEIHSKILDLGFDDCRVLVSSVDSQASLNGGIIIQVLGEMSNKGGPSQKFAQTFFLAEQPNGYFVLNDIFRYLKDEVDEEFDYEADIAEDVAAEALSEPVQEEESMAKQEVAPIAEEAQDVQGVATALETEPKPSQLEVAEVPADVSASEKTEANSVSEQQPKSVEPKAPVEPAKQRDSQPNKGETTPSNETKPAFKSWANLAANGRDKWGSKVSEVRGPSAKNQQPQPASQPSQPQPQPQPSLQPQPQQQQQKPQQPSQSSQTQRNSRQDIPLTRSNGYKQDENLSVFVKGVQEGMTPEMFKTAFSSVGPVKAVDVIVPKNCAFVEFTTAEAYKSAITQSTFVVNGENVYAEERRKSFRQPGRPNYNQGERRGGYHQNSERGGRRGRGGRPFNRASADKLSK